MKHTEELMCVVAGDKCGRSVLSELLTERWLDSISDEEFLRQYKELEKGIGPTVSDVKMDYQLSRNPLSTHI